MEKRFLSITGLVIVGVIVLAVNLLGGLLLGRAKVDMTQDKLYTLSKGSVNILGSLKDKIGAKLYYSKTAAAEVPPLTTYANRVIQMLKEYEGLSKGKFSLEILDPRPDTETEEWAEKYGLQGLPGPNNEKLYLGLVLRDESGNEESVRFLSPDREPTLEYDISKLIYSLSHPQKKKVGVLSSLKVLGQSAEENPFMRQQRPPQEKPWAFVRELKGQYEMVPIESTADKIPDDIDLLVIVHPKDLSETVQYAIDQYVLRGGKVVAFVDPFCEMEMQSMPADNMQMRMQASYSSNMPRLMKAWGVELEAESAPEGASPMAPPGDSMKLVADPSLALQVQMGGNVEKMPVWLALGDKNHSKEEIITADLENIMMFDAGGLKKTTSSEDIKAEPILFTSDNAGMVSDMWMKFGGDPTQIVQELKKQTNKSKQNLAFKITGKFKTSFPEGIVTTESAPEGEKKVSEKKKMENQLMESQQPATIILVADVDMISDAKSVVTQNVFGYEMMQPRNDNLAFLSNTVENLTGSEDLIALRSRGRSQRPFTKVQEIESKANEKWQAEEESLNKKLDEANKRLSALQSGGQERQPLGQAYMTEVDKFRKEKISTERELRSVRRSMREDKEALGFRVKFINIALLPLLFIALSIAIGLVKSYRRRTAS